MHSLTLLLKSFVTQAVLKSERGCVRARAAAEGVGGAQNPQGVCPGSYVAVHLADVPAALVLKLQQRVEASTQARTAFLLFQSLASRIRGPVSAKLFTANHVSKVWTGSISCLREGQYVTKCSLQRITGVLASCCSPCGGIATQVAS